MRKLILISALLLASVSAQAGETRSLSLAGIPTATTTAAANGSTAVEAPKPIAQVSAQLAQAATSANDAAPIQIQAPAAAPAPVQAQAPAATPTTTAPAAATTTTTATTTETKPATTATTESKKTVKKARRESDEAKARRIAARYGVYW
ncbi:hypothetical protein [Bradyrhizobium sp.]|uniref:hypothetical protein n=1 Tax=Bradyrhizobium sp. TaxID=376 RepID=UPI001D3014E3|nr:hypothetical protein [Bradyrhizobium sp.]MBI5321626.1 hypothetical protein [Bradyrhizobium sp.]